jgi:hypothetical protein
VVVTCGSDAWRKRQTLQTDRNAHAVRYGPERTAHPVRYGAENPSPIDSC